MMPNIEQAILVVSNSLAGSIIVKATIAISLALVAVWFARRSRASIRHAVLAAGFAVLLALPITAIVAPPIHIAVPMAQHPSASGSDSQQFGAEAPLATRTGSNSELLPAKSLTSEISLLDILFAAWAIGAALFLAPVIIGLWQVRSLRHTSLPWSRGDSIAATLGNETGVRRCVDVLLHESVAGPMTCGIFGPVILLSREAESWSDDDVSRAIAHELEHVRRGDWLTHCFAHVACAVYWFHPFVWIAWRKLTLEAERACDDAVIARSEATAYAEQLVALARQLSTASRPPVLAMASRSDLSARVNSVLDTRQRRGRTGAAGIALACVGALLLIAALSPLRMIAAQQSSTEDREKAAGGKMSFEVASVKANVSGPGPVTMGGFGQQTGGMMRGVNVPLYWYIGFAYKLDHAQQRALQEKMPSWAQKIRFDIEAHTPSSSLTADQRRLMMQSLLAERFKMTAHFETTDGPAYALVLGRAEKLGSQMRAYPDGFPCSEEETTARGGRGEGPGPAASTVDDGRLPAACGGIHTLSALDSTATHQAGRNLSMDAIVAWISQAGNLDRPLVDRTGLSGTFDVSVEYEPAAPPSPDAAAEPREAAFLGGVSDQLGLKLESITAPVRTLVIDHIEEPTPN